MSDARHRLETVTERLKEQGVVDVKFTFSPDVKAHPLSVVTNGVAQFLECVVDGRGVPLQLIDSPNSIRPR